jgi:hypothetical protein
MQWGGGWYTGKKNKMLLKCGRGGGDFKTVKCFADLDVNGRIKLKRSLKI